MLQSFCDLVVWQKAHALALDIYRTTERFPERERFGIVAQVRRSATSTPANVAEGFGRRTTKELIQCLTISKGSLEETRYFLILSRDLKYIDPEEFRDLNQKCDSVGQMLSALMRSLRNRNAGSVASSAPGSQVTPHGSRTTSHGPKEAVTHG